MRALTALEVTPSLIVSLLDRHASLLIRYPRLSTSKPHGISRTLARGGPPSHRESESPPAFINASATLPTQHATSAVWTA